jgi:Family of unknown function (DUF6510)
MDDSQLRLDGNAVAGAMGEIFAQDMTAARGKCAICGTIAQMGSQPLYMNPLSPGAVLRCSTCQQVLMVMVHAEGRYRLGLQGLKWFDVPEVANTR